MSHARELFDAVEKNNTEIALRLLEETNAKDSKNDFFDGDGNSALHLAILNDNRPLAIALIKSDPKRLLKLNKKEFTPLNLNIRSLELIRIIDDKKIIDNCGLALLIAASFNQTEIVETLLEMGVKSTYSDKNGLWPIHYAAVYRNDKMLRAFIRAGYDTNQTATIEVYYKDKVSLWRSYPSSITPLELVSDEATQKIRDILRETHPISYRSKNSIANCKKTLRISHNNSIEFKKESKLNLIPIPPSKDAPPNAKILLRTVAMNQTNSALTLLEQAIHAVDDYRSEEIGYPIHWAVINKNNELIKKLIEKDPERFKQTNIKNQTPIALAAALGDWQRVKIIATLAALYPQSLESHGMGTALLLASKSNQTDCVELLVKAGAESNVADVQGYYGLHYAVLHGNEKMIRAFVEAGHDILQENNNTKETPLDLASKNNLESIVVLLQKPLKKVSENKKETPQLKTSPALLEEKTIVAKTSYSRALLLAVKNNQTKTALSLLQKEHCQSAENDWCSLDDGDSLLGLAVKNNNKMLIEALIKADPMRLTKKNRDNETPIKFATNLKKWDLVITIARSHESIVGADYGGALLWAAEANHTQCVKTLLEAKAPSDRYSGGKCVHSGEFPLHYAVRNKNYEMIQAFIDAGHNVHELSRNEDKISPFELASSLNYEKCISALLKPKTIVQNTKRESSYGRFIGRLLADSKHDERLNLPSIESRDDLKDVILKIASGQMQANIWKELAKNKKQKVKEKVLAYLQEASFEELDEIFSLNAREGLAILGTPLAKFFAIARGARCTDPGRGTLSKFLLLEENYRAKKKDALVLRKEHPLFKAAEGENSLPSAPLAPDAMQALGAERVPSAPLAPSGAVQAIGAECVPSAPLAPSGAVQAIGAECVPSALEVPLEIKPQAADSVGELTVDQEPGNPSAVSPTQKEGEIGAVFSPGVQPTAPKSPLLQNSFYSPVDVGQDELPLQTANTFALNAS